MLSGSFFCLQHIICASEECNYKNSDLSVRIGHNYIKNSTVAVMVYMVLVKNREKCAEQSARCSILLALN